MVSFLEGAMEATTLQALSGLSNCFHRMQPCALGFAEKPTKHKHVGVSDLAGDQIFSTSRLQIFQWVINF